jgi:hypothetical protein
MKELIEEKAKRFNEALKAAVVAHKDEDKHLKATLERIFPELKESENEKIRKVLVDYFKRYKEHEECGIKTFYGIPTDDILAWLEKQGEQKPNYCHHEVDLSGCSEEYRKAYYDGWNNCNMQHSQCKSELDDVVKCLINGMKFYYEDNEEATWGTDKWSMPVKHIIEVLEKQGEQKSQGKSAVEAINEEKVDNANKLDNTYKDDLKFHIGNWVVTNNTKIVFLIKSYNSGYYTLEDINGNTYSPCTAPTEEDYHLWTLKDAKDGDILASKSGDKIFSYRGSLDLRGNPCAYYGIYKVHDGICFSPCAIGNSFTCEEVFPATKEQRKTLFEEMTAAKGVLHFNKKEK